MSHAPTAPHHGRNLKRIREILGVKQDALAVVLGVSQQAVSQLEQKETLDEIILNKAAKALGVPEEALRNFSEDATITILSSTLHDNSGSINYFPTFNPVDKIVQLYDEKIVLYERMLEAEKEKNRLLQKIVDAKIEHGK